MCVFCFFGVFLFEKMDYFSPSATHSSPEAELRLLRRQHQEALLCSLALRYAVGVEDDIPELPERTPSMDVERVLCWWSFFHLGFFLVNFNCYI